MLAAADFATPMALGYDAEETYGDSLPAIGVAGGGDPAARAHRWALTPDSRRART
jgi:hypothetical protein